MLQPLTCGRAFARLFVQAFAPPVIMTPAGPIDARARYCPPHRPVGARRRLRRGNPGAQASRGLAVIAGRVEAAPFRPKLSGARGAR